MALEGVRGLAAIAVVLHHYVVAFYPALDAGVFSVAHTRLEDNIYGTPLALVFAGRLAVAVFFVLSGFVLSIGYFQMGDETRVRRMALGRYLRLMLPALASVLIAFSLVSAGTGTLTKETGEITKSTWLEAKWQFEPNLVDAIHVGTLDIFTQNDSVPYNSVLWTMYTEFIGSFIVFIFLIFFAKSKYRWIAYGVLGVATFATWFFAFVIGMAMADAYATGRLDRLRHPTVLFALFVSAVFFGSYPKKSEGMVYDYIRTDLFSGNYRTLSLTLAATSIILLILLSKRLAAWLSRPRISTLGRYTFALYLTHLLVLYAFSTAVFLALHNLIGYNKAVLLTVIASVPVLWLSSYLFERFIDEPSIRLAKYMTNHYIAKE